MTGTLTGAPLPSGMVNVRLPLNGLFPGRGPRGWPSPSPRHRFRPSSRWPACTQPRAIGTHLRAERPPALLRHANLQVGRARALEDELSRVEAAFEAYRAVS